MHGKSDPLETTAYALRFEWTMNPQSPRVHGATAFLIDKINSGWAATTKDTAAIVYALSDVLPPQNQELAPHEKVAIWIDHRLVRTISVDTAELDAADSQLVVPAERFARRQFGADRASRRGFSLLVWRLSSDTFRSAAHSVADVSGSLDDAGRSHRMGYRFSVPIESSTLAHGESATL